MVSLQNDLEIHPVVDGQPSGVRHLFKFCKTSCFAHEITYSNHFITDYGQPVTMVTSFQNRPAFEVYCILHSHSYEVFRRDVGDLLKCSQ